MTFTSLSDAIAFETPNAVMRTYASPAVGDNSLAVWRTEMVPGASGPLHATDVEQVVVVVDGRLLAVVDGVERVLEPGDAVVLAAGTVRRLANAGDLPVVTFTAAQPGAMATAGDAAPVPVPWAR
jgi:quercetin dioxygenase-like cupin family protein